MIRGLILTLFLSLQGCSGHLEVIPRGCFSDDSNFLWSLDFETGEEPDFIIKKRVWTRGLSFENSDSHKVYIKRFLGEEGVACKDVKNLKVAIEQSSKDVLLSILPFVSRHTVTIEGFYIN